MDLFAAEEAELRPREWKSVRTGICVEIPPGYEGQVRPRSGLARRHGLTLLNSPGTIDEGYRGEIGVVLINHGRTAFWVERGMRVAQLVVQPRVEVEVVEAETLSSTDRGAGGFGSTGS